MLHAVAVGTDDIDLIAIGRTAVGELPGLLPGVHVVGDADDHIGAVIGGLSPDLGIVAIGTDDGGDAAALGTGGDGAFPAGVMALGGNPGVHFAVLVYHLTLIIDHDGAVAGGFVALQLKDDAKDAPDLQAGAGLL